MADVSGILAKARSALEQAENAEFARCRQANALLGLGWIGMAIVMIIEDVELRDERD